MASAGRATRVAVVVVALVGAGLALVAGPGAGPAAGQAEDKPDAQTAINDLVEDAPAGSTLVRAAGGSALQLVGAPAGEAIEGAGGEGPSAQGQAPGDEAEAAAESFVAEHGDAFGEPDPDRDLELVDEVALGGGGTGFTFQQTEAGVPVLAGEVRVQVDGDGSVVSAAGEVSLDPEVDPEPGVGEPAAVDAALDAVAEDEGVEPGLLEADGGELQVFDPSLVGEGDAPPRLVRSVEVRGAGTVAVRQQVLVDAATSEVVLAIDGIHAAKDRYVCDSANVSGASYLCSSPPYARTEGGAASPVAQVNLAYDLSGQTYDYYFAELGRDSIDDAGMDLRSTVRACPEGEACPYPNAFWDGTRMVYGDGYAGADDVVAHELTHGVTEHESGLIYLNQSGAINESLSDVFGELVDLTNGTGNDTAGVRWDVGEDLPIGAIRDMADPGRFGDPDRMTSPDFYTGPLDGGGVHTNSGVSNKAASLLVDGGSFNGQTVGALGTTKTGHVYYEAQVSLLVPGSDYAALGAALPQACTNLVGTHGITTADCEQVEAAVAATEMVLPPPANDAFADALALDGPTGTETGSTLGATKEAGEPGHAGNGGGASIWYSFTAEASGPATIDTFGSGFDTLLAVYTGSSVDGLSPVAADDDSGGTLQSEVTFAATEGTTYSIAVDGWAGARGPVTLSWDLAGEPPPVPVNDDFADAADLAGPSGSVEGTTIGASFEPGEPDHAGATQPGGRSVWYRHTATADGALVVGTCDLVGITPFDTTLGVYTGSGVGALSEVGSNDDSCLLQSEVEVEVSAGTTYRVAVAGWQGEAGAFRLHWYERPIVFSDVPLAHPFFDDIGWMAAEGISTGYADGTYQPGAVVTRQAMSAFMYRLAGEPELEAPAVPSFSDVPTQHPFFDEVEWMAAEGISTGYADSTFKPAAPVSRQAMSAFMYRLAGEPELADPPGASFVDVPVEHPFFHEVEWMLAEGITNGYADGTFKPAAPVSRQAMSAFMHRLADGPGVGI